ncbi:hypothetical protein FI667_g8347, partial [Globisporangium splendens]
MQAQSRMEEFLYELIHDYDGKLLDIHLDDDDEDPDQAPSREDTLDISISLASCGAHSRPTVQDDVQAAKGMEVKLHNFPPVYAANTDVEPLESSPTTPPDQRFNREERCFVQDALLVLDTDARVVHANAGEGSFRTTLPIEDAGDQEREAGATDEPPTFPLALCFSSPDAYTLQQFLASASPDVALLSPRMCEYIGCSQAATLLGLCFGHADELFAQLRQQLSDQQQQEQSPPPMSMKTPKPKRKYRKRRALFSPSKTKKP